MAVTGSQVLGGRYVLNEVLGVGGMATVWRARDKVLARDVAIKVLSQQFAADAAFLARFEREARHAAGLSHPRLVTVFDSGVDGTTPYIVMELLTGRTLRQELDEAGTLPATEAVGIAAAVCEALEVAHAAGLVHRDIKPANIVLVAAGQVKVLDFGIARAEGTGGTRTLAVLGTAAYLSPEQASGRRSGPQADLYSVGCVLYEMLTGAPPFAADSAVGLAYRQVHDDPDPPSARRAGLPARLDEITLRLLAKDPADRPASAAAARTELLAALVPAGPIAGAPAPDGPAPDGPAPDGAAPGSAAPDGAAPDGAALGSAALASTGLGGTGLGGTALGGAGLGGTGLGGTGLGGTALGGTGLGGTGLGSAALAPTTTDGTAVLSPADDLPRPGGPDFRDPVSDGAVSGGAGGGSAPVGSAPVGSAPVGSAPVGSAPSGTVPGGAEPGSSDRRLGWHPRPLEIALAAALAATLLALAVVLLINAVGRAGPGPSSPPAASTHQTPSAARTQPGTPSAAPPRAGALPPAAKAAGTFVGDLEAGVADGQVTQQAGADLFNHLQQLLFQPGQNALQIQQQYQQLVQSYDQYQSQGQITGPAVGQLRQAIAALGAAVGAL